MKAKIKPLLKLLPIVVVLITTSITSTAQYELARPINNQLRTMFSQITYPDTSVEFLYQRSANMIDSTLYDHLNTDTIHTAQWNQIYKEMYYAAHDTNTQIHLDSIDKEITQYAGDTINFGIMHWNHYRLKKVSLTNGNYFVFDTVADILYDHASPVSTPYILDSLFMAAPLKNESEFKNVVYKINPSLIFTDAKTFHAIKSKYILEIDFGDGAGYLTISPTIESFINVTYSSNGKKVIKTRLTPITESGNSFSSRSTINVKLNEIAKVEDYFIRDIPGMTVGVYKACQSGKNNKKIIVIKGIDTYAKIPSKKLSNAYYYSRIKSKHLHNLRNYGYDMMLVDWNDSRVDIRLNAYSLLLLIEKLKMEDAKNGNNQEYVIIGISLGGIVAKYTLNYMESNHYQNDDYEPFFVEAGEQQAREHMWQYKRFKQSHYKYKVWNTLKRKVTKHNTRLLITIDSPHQGANIPLSVQHLMRKGKRIFDLVSRSPESNRAMNERLTMIDKKATKQLLKYWVPYNPVASTTYSHTNSYSAANDFSSFFNQIKFDNGGNPRFCKVVALSDGAMDGSPQQSIITNTDRVPNDYLIKLNADLDINVFWQSINLLHIQAELHTNPAFSSSSETVSYISVGRRIYTIELYWFGVDIVQKYFPVITQEDKAINVQPYCTTAGGIRDEFKLTNMSVYVGGGIIYGMFGLYLDVNIHTHGTHTCFVPLESALNYTGSLPFNNDILNAPIATKMNNTPFDVIAGNVYKRSSTKYSKPNWLNTEHAWIRNDRDKIFNMTQLPAAGANPDSDDKFAYFTCADKGNYQPLRTFLSLEIGDEEMYLENFLTDRQTSYRPEYNVKVNVRNPYYWYPNTTISPLKLKGIFSKKNDFNIVSNSYTYPAHATFLYDVSSFLPSPSPAPARAGLDIAHLNAYSTAYSSGDVPYQICCDPSPRPQPESENSILVKKQQIKDSATLSIYPNPSLENGILWIKSLLPKGETSARVSIYNSIGKQIYTISIEKTKGSIKLEKPLNLRKINLAKGIYVLKLNTKSNTVSKRLIIQ